MFRPMPVMVYGNQAFCDLTQYHPVSCTRRLAPLSPALKSHDTHDTHTHAHATARDSGVYGDEGLPGLAGQHWPDLAARAEQQVGQPASASLYDYYWTECRHVWVTSQVGAGRGGDTAHAVDATNERWHALHRPHAQPALLRLEREGASHPPITLLLVVLSLACVLGVPGGHAGGLGSDSDRQGRAGCPCRLSCRSAGGECLRISRCWYDHHDASTTALDI